MSSTPEFDAWRRYLASVLAELERTDEEQELRALTLKRGSRRWLPPRPEGTP